MINFGVIGVVWVRIDKVGVLVAILVAAYILLLWRSLPNFFVWNDLD